MASGGATACQLPDVPKCQLLTKEHEMPKNMKRYVRPINLNDITGFDTHQVIACSLEL